MSDTSADDKVHGEVTAGELDPDSRSQPSEHSIATDLQTTPPTYEVTQSWIRIHTKNLTSSDEYIFDTTKISPRKMVHVLQCYEYTRKHTRNPRLFESYQKKVISELLREMDSSGFFQQNKLPAFSFDDSYMFISCPDETVLLEVYNFCRGICKLAGKTFELHSKGLPFTPKFWKLRGLLAFPDLATLKADLNDYLTQYANYFGRTRAVWALCYTVEGIEGKKSFAGSVELLTDASNITSQDKPPRFRGVQINPSDTPFWVDY